MGTYETAIMTGFICRLCSAQKKNVIHLYSGKAKELNLMKKIKLLPIKIEKYDNLPKTICEKCIGRLDFQYNLVLKIKKNVSECADLYRVSSVSSLSTTSDVQNAPSPPAIHNIDIDPNVPSESDQNITDINPSTSYNQHNSEIGIDPPSTTHSQH